MPIELKVPKLGESIVEVEIGQWLKNEGDAIEKDENIVVLETEKAAVELPAPASGTLTKIVKKKGETVAIGEVIGQIEETEAVDKKAKEQPPAEAEPAATQPATPAGTPERAKEDVPRPIAEPLEETTAPPVEEKTPTPAGTPERAEEVVRLRWREKPRQHESTPERAEEVVPMSVLRRHLAKRLVEAQHTAALLTTFNEIDMAAVIALRQQHQEVFQKRYNIKLGFMSFFVKAAIDSLKLVPQLNAEIRGDDIAYRNYHDIGVAVDSSRGLVVPVLRNAERMRFSEIEAAIADFARRAQEGQLKLEELQGGTFTISNGGIYGSLFSTPIVNPPQSGILGMHVIQERPVVREGQVVIRPMMYVALTYDHRIVDGREAVTFLRRIKEVIEQPARMLIEV